MFLVLVSAFSAVLKLMLTVVCFKHMNVCVGSELWFGVFPGGQSLQRAPHQVPDTPPLPNRGAVHDGGHPQRPTVEPHVHGSASLNTLSPASHLPTTHSLIHTAWTNVLSQS